MDRKLLQEAREKYGEFVRLRDDALFHGLVLTGVDASKNLERTRSEVQKALAAFGMTAAGTVSPVVPLYLKDRRQEIADGCYELLLVLAEAEVQSPSGRTEDRLQRALGLLDRAAQLGPPTRALHLHRTDTSKLWATSAAPGGSKNRPRPASRPPPWIISCWEWSIKPPASFPRRSRTSGSLRKRTPDISGAYYYLSLVYLSNRRADRAQSHLHACVALKPDFPWPYLLRGIVHDRLNDYAAAEWDYREGLKHAANLPDARYGILVNRSEHYTKQKKYESAIADLRSTLPSSRAGTRPIGISARLSRTRGGSARQSNHSTARS